MSISIIFLSMAEYIFFYNMYIPNVNIKSKIDFDYSIEPKANFSLINRQWLYDETLNINYPEYSYPLSSLNSYDILLHATVANIYDKTLVLPIKTRLTTENGLLLGKSISSFILPYRNYILKLIRDVLYVFPTLIGWSNQETRVSTYLLKGYYEDSINRISHIEIDITSKGVDIYDTEIEFISCLTVIRCFVLLLNWI